MNRTMNRIVKAAFIAGMSAGLLTGTVRAEVTADSLRTASDTLRVRPFWREVDIKTNLVHDATQSISLGVEIGLSPRWSLDLSGAYNGWEVNGGQKWKHWLAQPEARWWTKQAFSGHFLGLHLLGGQYNIGSTRLPFGAFHATDESRYQGRGAGAGLAYGYRWNFTDRWGMEGSLGLGYIYTEYDRYECRTCGEKLGNGSKHYFGPTKAALNLIYRFGGKKRAKEALVTALTPVRIEERIVRDTVVIRDTTVLRDTVLIEKSAPKPPAVKHDKYTLRLQYRTGSAVLQRAFGDNDARLQGLAEYIGGMKEDTTITIQAIRVTGYSSIEGTAALNLRLSHGRAQGVAEFLRSLYPALAETLSVQGAGEDWDGLLALVREAYGLERRDEIERIITEVDIHRGRERQLMQLAGGRPYRRMLAELFPELRRVEVTIDYTARERR